MQQLSAAMDKRLILVTAPAGYGKSTLLAEWLHSSDLSWAWLSLDQADSDLATFLAYFIAAIQTADPGSCKNVQDILQGPRLPSLTQLATALINDLAELSNDVILVLDDYQLIKERAVHELVNALAYRRPRRLHLVISARANPPLPLPQWRARGYMAEIRAADLCFTGDEAQAFLAQEIGEALPERVAADLVALTEGWITGLKLAAISIRDRAARAGHGGDFVFTYEDLRAASANRHIADFLLEDVFSRQPRAIREFLIRTSILDQFTAGLCDALGSDSAIAGAAAGAVIGAEAGDADDSVPAYQAHFVLKWIERANLFIIPLDGEQRWYRYHHLFRELLSHRLKQKHTAAEIAQLHVRASAWLAGEGLIEPALGHALAGGDMQRAADLVEQHRHVLLDSDNWRTLERWLGLLPEELVQARPGLLMARAWVLHFQSRLSDAALIIQAISDRLPDLDVTDAQTRALQGAVAVFRGHFAHGKNQFDEAIACAEVALELIPHDCSYARGIAAIVLGLSSQAIGNGTVAASTLKYFFDHDPDRGSPFALRALLTLAWMDCIAGRWDKVRVQAEYGLKLADQAARGLLAGWAHLFLGLHHYQWNDLDRAIEHFGAAAQSRYRLNKACASSCLIGLSLSYFAQGKPRQAVETADVLAEFALEAQDPGMLFESQAFRAHLSLLQNDVAPALHWAQTTDFASGFGVFNLSEAPSITQLRAFIADGAPASLGAATSLLESALAFARSTHNVWRQVELLAIQALLLRAQGQTEAALDALEQALALARPGRFVRSFLDLGQDLADLLTELARRDRQADYACELLAAFGQPVRKLDHAGPKANGHLIEPLTNREVEILNLIGQHLSNEEIARALFVSPLTVKSHIRNLFDKLGVKRRRFAIQRARELGLLPAAQDAAGSERLAQLQTYRSARTPGTQEPV